MNVNDFRNMEARNLHWVAIRKEDIENKRFGLISGLLKEMDKLGKKSKQSVCITFSGYDNITDEIFEIDAIRQWTKVLLNKYPQIFYYLNLETEALQNILLCYCDLETFFVGEKKPASSYSIEDHINDRVPQQQIYLKPVSSVALTRWKKEVKKVGKKYNDPTGAEKVINDLEKILPN